MSDIRINRFIVCSIESSFSLWISCLYYNATTTYQWHAMITFFDSLLRNACERIKWSSGVTLFRMFEEKCLYVKYA
jgi:hypothetical protein